MLWSTVNLALSIDHINFKTISSFLKSRYFLSNDIVSILSNFSISILNYHLMIDGHLLDGGVTTVSRKKSCTTHFRKDFSLSHRRIGLELYVACSAADGWLLIFLGVGYSERLTIRLGLASYFGLRGR